MNKRFLTAGITVLLFFFTGFRGRERVPVELKGQFIPEEKKELLKKIVGRWITQTNIHARNGQSTSKVIGSDVWQWSPDGNFLLHTAYGIRDKKGFGEMEVTGYNSKTGAFDSYNFNPDGSFSMGTLTIDNNIWIWSSKEVKTTGVMDGDGKILPVKHEITDNGRTYRLFMDGILTKGSDY